MFQQSDDLVVTFIDGAPDARIITRRPAVITKLRSLPAAVETATHPHGVEFSVPRELVGFRAERVRG
jgi:hypothetical protein